MRTKLIYQITLVLPFFAISLFNTAQCNAQANAFHASYVKASNPEDLDFFGWSVALSENTLVVGARGEDSDGDQSNNLIGDSGAAFVFIKINDSWAQQDFLKASNPGDFDEFGTDVAIDGDTLVIGAPNERSGNGMQSDNSATNAGAVYVFTYDGESWGQQAYLKAPTIESFNNFGHSVSISGDTLVVGEPRQDNDAGAVHVFTRSNGIWSFQETLKASNADSDDSFGWDVAIDVDTIVVGAFSEDSDGVDDGLNSVNDSGAAYVFTRAANIWSQHALLKASNPGETDSFGSSVDVSANNILIGASGESSNAKGINGDQNNDSLMFSGAAYLFSENGNSWNQMAYIKASNTNDNDRFGSSVAILGNQFLVGALNEGSNSTGVAGNQGDNSFQFAGAAYAFKCQVGVCSQKSYIKSSNSDNGDFFAGSVAMSPDNAVFGSPGESGDLTSADGSFNNSADGAGAVYSYVTQAIFVSDLVYANGFETKSGR